MIPDLVYDVGMNNGDDTAYYLHRGFRVVAVEANPALAERASHRFQREIAARRLVILNVGIAEQPGQLAFWICETMSEWSSFDRRSAARDGCSHHAITVDCRCFGSILEEYGVPYYLKVDIEGNDGLCLKDLDKKELPKYVSFEGVGYLDLLRDLGYTGFKCISQFSFIPLEIPPSKEERSQQRLHRLLNSKFLPLRVVKRLGLRRMLYQWIAQSRRYGDWDFPRGSSGPFGEDLPGRWQSFEEIKKTYRHFEQVRERGEPSLFWTEKDYSFWTDMHARRDG